jgi:hypothetical protein
MNRRRRGREISAPRRVQAAAKIKPAIEAVRQARDDEKYFKPLKRF